MRVLGLDYGSVTVGTAVSDALGITVQPLETIRRSKENHLRRTLSRIAELAGEYEVEKIVVGLPRNMDNTLGERARAAADFADRVRERTGLEVILWDERLTTAEAGRALEEAGIRRERRKEVIDQMAAVLILRNYLAAQEYHG